METVENGKTGLVLPPDPHVWAEEISKLLKQPELMRQMGIAGRERILSHYTWEHQLGIIKHIDDLDPANNLLKEPIA